MDWTETIKRIIDSKLTGKPDLVSEMKYRKFLENWAISECEFLTDKFTPLVNKVWADNIAFPLLLASLKQENNLSEDDFNISLSHVFRYCAYEDIKLLFENGLKIERSDLLDLIKQIFKNGLNVLEKVNIIINSYKEKIVLYKTEVIALFQTAEQNVAIEILKHKNILVEKDCFSDLRKGIGMDSEKSVKTLISKGASLENAISWNLNNPKAIKLFIELGATIKLDDLLINFDNKEQKETFNLLVNNFPNLKDEIKKHSHEYFFSYAPFQHSHKFQKFLIENGADINMRNDDGDTLLFDASYHAVGELEHIEYLLNKGLNPCEKNKNNKDIIDFAKKGKHDYSYMCFSNMRQFDLDCLADDCETFKYKPEEFHHLSFIKKLKYFINHIENGGYETLSAYFCIYKPKSSMYIDKTGWALRELRDYFDYLKAQDEVIEFLENAQKEYLLKQQNKQNETEKE